MSSRFAGRFGAAHHHGHNNPARESVPVWEQQWVLPTPGSRIKVLKWVKSPDNRTRTFPETEDARYIYATNDDAAAKQQSSQQQQQLQNDDVPLDVDAPPTDAQIHTTGAATSDEAAHVQPAAVEDGVSAADVQAPPMGDPDETQGGHLFDETMKPVGEDDDEDDDDKADVTKADVDMKVDEGPPLSNTTTSVLPPPPPGGDEEEGEEGEEGGGDNDEAEEEEEEEEEETVDKHSTIRIGGPLPTTSGEEAESQPHPEPQVSAELHPTDDDDSSMSTAKVEQDPASAVDTNADDDPVITTVTRDDPDVKGLGDGVEAVVHEQPDGVQQVKVVEEESSGAGKE